MEKSVTKENFHKYDDNDREARRKCFKCGKSPRTDNVSLFRFPKPALRNHLRCLLWAKFMFPDESKYTSLEFQTKLHTEHRMLCEDHFNDIDFTDETKCKLLRDVTPSHKDKSDTEAAKKIYVPNVNVDHCYSRTEPPPPSRPIVNNAMPKVDSAIETSSSAYMQTVNIQKKGIRKETQQSQSLEYDETRIDDIEDEIEPLFSWQLSSQICLEEETADDEPSVVATSNKQNLPKKTDSQDPQKNDSKHPIEIDGLQDDDKVPEVDPTTTANKQEVEYKSEKHSGYSCDFCMGEIIGFRYKCVQCENYDLCRACETRLVHPHHYMLRLPRPTPFNEVKSMIEAIRERIKILTEEIRETTNSMELKNIKEETIFEEVPVDPFEELDTTDLVPDVPIEEHIPIHITPRSRETDVRPSDKNIQTTKLFKQWDTESHATEITESEDVETESEDVESYTTDSEDLEDIAKENKSRKRKLESEETYDKQTVKLEDMRRHYFDEKWIDENNPSTGNDIRHIENNEVEWLDESILENEEVKENRNDDLDKTKKDPILKSFERNVRKPKECKKMKV